MFLLLDLDLDADRKGLDVVARQASEIGVAVGVVEVQSQVVAPDDVVQAEFRQIAVRSVIGIVGRISDVRLQSPFP